MFFTPVLFCVRTVVASEANRWAAAACFACTSTFGIMRACAASGARSSSAAGTSVQRRTNILSRVLVCASSAVGAEDTSGWSGRPHGRIYMPSERAPTAMRARGSTAIAGIICGLR